MEDHEHFSSLVETIRDCTLCRDQLEPNPIIQVSEHSKVLLIGQAPGLKVHQTGIPWNDPSGRRLRSWMNWPDSSFYNPEKLAIIPSAFCYPGRGRSGDLAPPSICAKTWHQTLFSHLKHIEMVLLVGLYAQRLYLGKRCKLTLTDTVADFRTYAERNIWVLPHPSPRNQIWLKKNPWFEQELVPELQTTLSVYR